MIIRPDRVLNRRLQGLLYGMSKGARQVVEGHDGSSQRQAHRRAQGLFSFCLASSAALKETQVVPSHVPLRLAPEALPQQTLRHASTSVALYLQAIELRSAARSLLLPHSWGTCCR